MGLPVSITARSMDAAGHVDLTDPVWSTSSGAVVLAGGAAHTAANPIPVQVFAAGDPHIRFKVDGVVTLAGGCRSSRLRLSRYQQVTDQRPFRASSQLTVASRPI